MYCTNCGQPTRARARFCTNCGEKLRRSFAVAAEQHQPPGSSPATDPGATVPLRVADLRDYAEQVAARELTPAAPPAARQTQPEGIAPKTTHKYYRPGWPAFLVVAGLAVLLNALTALLIDSSKVTAYWSIARVSGFVIYGLLTLSVSCGIFMSLKWRAYRGLWLVAERLHPLLLLGAALFTTLHIGGLLLIDFPLVQAVIPLTSDYRTPWLALGIVSVYLGAALILSTYLIGYIGFRVWRFLHYGAFIAWAFALAHGLATGHDSGLTSARAYYAVGAALVGGLLLVRLVRHIMTLRQPLAPARAGAH